jgi:hypothetical protein
MNRSAPQDIVSQHYEKVLPTGGRYVRFTKLAKDISDVEFQDFLASCNLILPLEHISIRSFNDGSAAIILLSDDLISTLVNWVIDFKQLNGREVIARSGKGDLRR